MSGYTQLELHYINTGFPFTVTESFMDLFEGLSYARPDYSHHQLGRGDAWTVYSDSYKNEFSAPSTTPYYGYSDAYEINNRVTRSDGIRRTQENYSMMNYEDSLALVVYGSHGNVSSYENGLSTIEECNRTPYAAGSSQSLWQDNVDPDNMSYEELLDLGEAVGTHNRGLSQEQILSLPVSKYKCGFFSRRKKNRERCVICQMEYKRGDRRMTLPCKHAYHASCVSRWLGINKACPVCFIDVFGEHKP